MSNSLEIENYIQSLSIDRQEPISKLHEVILNNLPKGFEAGITYKMIGYFVPHSIYPAGYHCNLNQALPFINLASQKNYISIHHMGFYMGDLEQWFKDEYTRISKKKLDLGKCCMRFKKIDEIPYELIGKLCQKISVQDWISYYEEQIKK